MAEKFGNFRWIKEGYFDNRVPGYTVGMITFAAIGEVAICLEGDCRGELTRKIFRFTNSQFLEDPLAVERLADFDIPQIGRVSLISFDPHPLLDPHPYIEWFSNRGQHYRIELAPGDAWIVPEGESNEIAGRSQSILQSLRPRLIKPPQESSEQDWF